MLKYKPWQMFMKFKKLNTNVVYRIVEVESKYLQVIIFLQQA